MNKLITVIILLFFLSACLKDKVEDAMEEALQQESSNVKFKVKDIEYSLTGAFEETVEAFAITAFDMNMNMLHLYIEKPISPNVVYDIEAPAMDEMGNKYIPKVLVFGTLGLTGFDTQNLAGDKPYKIGEIKFSKIAQDNLIGTFNSKTYPITITEGEFNVKLEEE